MTELLWIKNRKTPNAISDKLLMFCVTLWYSLRIDWEAAYMTKKRRIGIGVPWHYGCTRAILRGIAAYAEQEEWDVRLCEPTVVNMEMMRQWQPDGYLVDPDLPEYMAAPRMTGVPTVIVPDVWNAPGLPGVSMDNYEIGRIAADYFLKKGFKSFCFAGTINIHWSEQRLRGFQQHLEEAGSTCQLIIIEGGKVEESVETNLVSLLQEASIPMGILACNDVAGRCVVQALNTLGRQVPAQFAVLGVDNDDVFCRMSRPTLSSVDLPWERMGYTAAQLLDQIMSGIAPPQEPILMPPTGVKTRQSTDVLAVEDEDVRMAMRYIADHATQRIGVEDVVGATNISRRVLERRFRTLLGTTPLDEIRSVRIGAARRLLTDSDLSMSQVAVRSGFGSAERLCVSFQEQMHMSPVEYRRRYRMNKAGEPMDTIPVNQDRPKPVNP